MKFRSGFVSNSSSSSFECDICGVITEIYDWESLFNAGLGVCPQGHQMHIEDIKGNVTEPHKKLTNTDIQKIIANSTFVYLHPTEQERIELICRTYAEGTLIYEKLETDKRLFENFIPTKLCPICQKTRIPMNEIINFLLNKCGFQTIEEAEIFLLTKTNEPR